MLKSQLRNLVLQTDSYKFTHWKQYPPGTQFVYSYLESRGGMFDQILFFGLQYYLMEYLAGAVVNEADVAEARAFVDQHIGPGVFNFDGWMHIVRNRGGRLPVVIKAVPEGTQVDVLNVLMTIENTDPQCYWLPNYLETLLLKVWYPITVATCRAPFAPFFWRRWSAPAIRHSSISSYTTSDTGACRARRLRASAPPPT